MPVFETTTDLASDPAAVFAFLTAPANLEQVTQPELSYVKKTSINYSYLTRDIVSGHGAAAQLTGYGAQLMRLLIWPD